MVALDFCNKNVIFVMCISITSWDTYLGERWEGERDMAMALNCRNLSKNVTLT